MTDTAEISEQAKRACTRNGQPLSVRVAKAKRRPLVRLGQGSYQRDYTPRQPSESLWQWTKRFICNVCG